MISAIVLAAGRSIRMGCMKLVLPWGDSTVIGSVIASLLKAGLVDIYVVTGDNRKELEIPLQKFEVNFCTNPDYSHGEMLSSVRVGLKCLGDDSEAAMIVLGDQPQIEAEVVCSIIDRYKLSRNKIIVPSYQMHRGHPWLIDRSLWSELLDIPSDHTLRDYLNMKQNDISYVNVNTESVIMDLDTPSDYQKYKP
jgi:molybdenum cofactor cytidylyltransferase